MVHIRISVLAKHMEPGSSRRSWQITELSSIVTDWRVFVRSLECAVSRNVSTRRPRILTTLPVAPNLLNQNFTPTAPNQVWVTDLTYVATQERWLYLAGIKDVYMCEIQEPFGLQTSMSRKDNCYDNAPMESFWGTLKNESLSHNRFKTRDKAISVVREYIEIFYNRQRRYSRLGNISPAVFRKKYYQIAA